MFNQNILGIDSISVNLCQANRFTFGTQRTEKDKRKDLKWYKMRKTKRGWKWENKKNLYIYYKVNVYFTFRPERNPDMKTEKLYKTE